MTARGVTARTFMALSNRNYRYFFGGQLVSTTGSWLQTTAQSWLILQLTHSAFMLGLLLMVQYLPSLLLQPFGGLVADRLPKRTLLIFTQASFALVSGALGLSVTFGVVRVWEVFVLVLITGLVNVIDSPARQSFVPEMVGFDQLPNAVALNSSVFNAARVVGPAVAGILIATVGTAICFELDAVSYLAVILALYQMHPSELHLVKRTGEQMAGTFGQLREGFSYARRTPEVMLVIAVMALVSIFSYNLSVMIPALARDGLHSGAATFGLLSASLGVGALAGALGVAYVGRAAVPAVLGGCAVFGAFLAVAAQLDSLFPLMVLLAGAGAGMIVHSSMSNSLIQLHTPARLRGRVMALYLWVFLGTTPIGSPLTGWIEQTWGSRAAMTIAGLAAMSIAAGGRVWWVRHGRATAYSVSTGPMAEAPTA